MMQAKQLVALLEQRHSSDLGVPECKNGPTHDRPKGAPRLRMDFWAMARSWTKPWTYGYEIKVSRGDFMSDDKWPGYLPYCNQFSFVCPHGVIRPDEVPAEAGLIYCSKNGTRLMAKKKAPHRDVQIPEQLWRYVLMCRASVGSEQGSDREFWQQWVAHRRIDREFGKHVGQSIRTAVHERIDEVERENVRLKRQCEAGETLGRMLDELGIDRDTHPFSVRMALREAMTEKHGALSPAVQRRLSTILRVAKEIESEVGILP